MVEHEELHLVDERERLPQPDEHLARLLRSDLLVPVEVHSRVVAAERLRFRDIVQKRCVAERLVRRHRAHGLEGVLEHVLHAVAPGFGQVQVGDLRQEVMGQAQVDQEPERLGRIRGQQQRVELLSNPLP